MQKKNAYPWEELEVKLHGELKIDQLTQYIYATDASVYRKLPLGVVFPKNAKDIQAIIHFARKNNLNLITRTAGTSLAGQCVGEGLIVDVSKHFTRILQVDEKNKTVIVEPGVIRDDLNRYLQPLGLFFGPNTSTSNRCMIGGMVGNNSSGTTSIQYGVTRDKVVALKTVLSDGSEVLFECKKKSYVDAYKQQNSLEAEIYKKVDKILTSKVNQQQILDAYPKASIHRRNTGYALDVLLNNSYYHNTHKELNLCDLLTGSEGTLAITTEITLQLDDLPPPQTAMVCAHFKTIESCLQAVVPVMKHQLYTCEMMDKTILDCTKNNLKQAKNRFFIIDDPKAILMLELKSDTEADLKRQVEQLIQTLENHQLSYAYPVLYNKDTEKALELRKAGLGLLGNMVGDRKAVACIEDTAVALNDLANYIEEFTALMNHFKQDAVYYAHAGAGEIHLRPILNLKKPEEVKLFKEITTAVATLVKKYQGSMSGEHGDGIVRSSFIPYMIGKHNYELLKQIKNSFDPQNIFNQGKIIAPLPMDENLRYEAGREEPEIHTLLDFSESQGILRVSEKCNGSGDCRKSVAAGGGMCPSYRATKNEKDTTRARANALREVLTHSTEINKFDSAILKEVFDLCVGCKACLSECPSNVDVTALKTEFLYQYQKSNAPSFRDKIMAHNNTLNRFASNFSRISNFIFKNQITASVLKKILHIAPQRSFPEVAKISFKQWLIKFLKTQQIANPIKEVYFFVDEFTNYLEVKTGMDAVILLTKLNYKIRFVDHKESGRAYISKGFLKEAKKIVNYNINVFKDIITEEVPLIGIEPSAILSFRDEYLKLATITDTAQKLARNVFTIDEFLTAEVTKKNIKSSQFSEETKEVKIHVHCHQKALSSTQHTFDILNVPKNFKPTLITSGCCGMAGSFGYEKEHYKASLQMGELSLLPKVRKASMESIISVTGTSCRHQIYEATLRETYHPVTILKEYLR